MSGPEFIDQTAAADVLAAVLGEPGGGRTVLGVLADLPTVQHRAAQPGGLFRRAAPESLLARDWSFVLAEPAGVRVLVQHVVRGIVLQSTLQGPADTGRQLAAALFEAADDAGPGVQGSLQSALYGLAAVSGR